LRTSVERSQPTNTWVEEVTGPTHICGDQVAPASIEPVVTGEVHTGPECDRSPASRGSNPTRNKLGLKIALAQ